MQPSNSSDCSAVFSFLSLSPYTLLLPRLTFSLTKTSSHIQQYSRNCPWPVSDSDTFMMLTRTLGLVLIVFLSSTNAIDNRNHEDVQPDLPDGRLFQSPDGQQIVMGNVPNSKKHLNPSPSIKLSAVDSPTVSPSPIRESMPCSVLLLPMPLPHQYNSTKAAYQMKKTNI